MYCYPGTSPHSPHHSYDMARATLFPVDTSPCPVLSANKSRLFPTRDHLAICGRLDFPVVLEHDNRNATSAPDTQ